MIHLLAHSSNFTYSDNKIWLENTHKHEESEKNSNAYESCAWLTINMHLQRENNKNINKTVKCTPSNSITVYIVQ